MNSLARTLANEEPSICTVSIRPGVVDTDMQGQIREKGANHMKAEDHARFTGLHRDGKLVAPQDPGAVLANLALHAKQDLSGQFVSWDAEEMSEYRASA